MAVDHRNDDKPKNGTADYPKKNGKSMLNGGDHVSLRDLKLNGNVDHDGKLPTATVPTHVAVPPDGGWGWVVVAASFCCNLIVDGIIYSFSMFLKEITTTFGESEAKVALIGSLLSGSYLIAGPFASALANRYGFRLVTMVGAVIGGLAFFLSSYATSVDYLCATYGILGGIGFGLIFVPAVITIGFYFEKWRAMATGIAVCGSGIGTFLMAPLCNWLIQQLTWRGAMAVQAGLVLHCALCGALFRPLKPMSVKVPVDENLETTNQSLILKTEILKKSKDKSASLLNVYEDLGITIEDLNDEKNLFNNNTKYPTASEILHLNANGVLDHLTSSQSLNDDRSAHNTVLISEKDLDKRIKPFASTKPLDRMERNHSESPELKKRNSVIPEMRILLNRKYSLQPYKSKSFTVSSTTTLDRTTSMYSRRNSKNDIGNRPLYRDDIFFNSNLKRLSQYTSQSSALDYTMSVTRLPTYTDILEEKKQKCSIFPEAMRRTLATMLDVSLLKSFTFNLLAVSGFITSMGMYIPFMFIKARAEQDYHIEESTTVWLISVLGIANTVGRVGFGVLSSIPKMNAVIISNAALTVCGLCTAFSGFSQSIQYQFLYASAFGLTIACFSSLRTIIVVDLLGLEKLTNAFGLLLLFQGVAAIIGPPMAGYFQEITKNYNTSFYISGALIVASAVMCYPIEALNRWEKKRATKHVQSDV
ncbi:monocarboxylate transporter 5-like [Planococcus citri]|uniref:monocarboxylate transporter 5-like n=1 Tax=Planococcus citri TaxID=170843 RepID=UPI0031F9F815